MCSKRDIFSLIDPSDGIACHGLIRPHDIFYCMVMIKRSTEDWSVINSINYENNRLLPYSKGPHKNINTAFWGYEHSLIAMMSIPNIQ